MEVEQWLLVWFEKNTDFTYDIIQQKVKTSFILEGWVDSLKFVSLITEIEDHFKIKFSGDEFHSEAFSTISGLTQLIQNKIQE